MRVTISDVTVHCLVGDIAYQPDVDAVVNAANAQLRPGGGVAGALHRAAGPGLEEECRRHAPIRPGEAVITTGHNLSTPYVIHCLGPVWGQDEPADELLASCYRQALTLAERHHLKSIAFPAISTGAFGCPLRDAANVALRSVIAACPALRHVKETRFVVTRENLNVFAEELVLLAAVPTTGRPGAVLVS